MLTAAKVLFGIMVVYALTLITGREQGPLETKIVAIGFGVPIAIIGLYYIAGLFVGMSKK